MNAGIVTIIAAISLVIPAMSVGVATYVGQEVFHVCGPRIPYIFKWSYLVGAILWVTIYAICCIFLLSIGVYAIGAMLSATMPQDHLAGFFVGLEAGWLLRFTVPIILVIGAILFLLRLDS